jgi:excisionase family DNA binding protein
LNSDFSKKSENGHQWLSISEAAELTPYSAEYLALLARKRKLPAKKVGKAWFTTKAAIEEYMRRQMIKTHIQNGGTEIFSQEIKSPREILNEIGFIQEKLTHGLIKKISEEKKTEVNPVLLEEMKKLSESLSGTLGGLS